MTMAYYKAAALLSFGPDDGYIEFDAEQLERLAHRNCFGEAGLKGATKKAIQLSEPVQFKAGELMNLKKPPSKRLWSRFALADSGEPLEHTADGQPKSSKPKPQAPKPKPQAPKPEGQPETA